MVRRGGRPLTVWRTPEAWLRSGCDGCVVSIIIGQALAGKAGGPFIVEDVAHGRELRQARATTPAGTDHCAPGRKGGPHERAADYIDLDERSAPSASALSTDRLSAPRPMRGLHLRKSRRRQWLYGRHLIRASPVPPLRRRRGQVLAAHRGRLAMATAATYLHGARTALNVWLFNGEIPWTNWSAAWRPRAALWQHSATVSWAPLCGQRPRYELRHREARKGRVDHLEPVVEAITAAITVRKIDVLIVDPLCPATRCRRTTTGQSIAWRRHGRGCSLRQAAQSTLCTTPARQAAKR